MAYGQDMYDYAIGARVGNPSALTFKTFLGRYTGYEILAGVNFSEEKNGFSATGLYQYHYPVFTYANAYAGAGLTMGYGNKFFVHADLQLGFEYMMSNFPLLFALDYKPAYNIFNRNIGNKGFLLYEYGVSIRYTIGKMP